MIEEILCVTQWRKAQHTRAYVSIYDASKVQNLPIRTIFYNSSSLFRIGVKSVQVFANSS